MIIADTNLNRWKTEQLNYFREYIKKFKPGSIEYIKLDQGIKTLESEN